ncbi:MAG: hypothetical protein ACKV2U_27395 [Bryobacteraceae bacterium]
MAGGVFEEDNYFPGLQVFGGFGQTYSNDTMATLRISQLADDPGRTTTYSAPMVTARRSSPRKAAMDLGRLEGSAGQRLMR